MKKETITHIIQERSTRVEGLIKAAQLQLDHHEVSTPTAGFTSDQQATLSDRSQLVIERIKAELKSGVAIAQLTAPGTAELLSMQPQAPIRLAFPNVINKSIESLQHSAAEAIGIVMPKQEIPALPFKPIAHLRFVGGLYLQNGQLWYDAPLAHNLQKGGDIEDAQAFLATTALFAQTGGDNHGHSPNRNLRAEIGHQLEWAIPEMRGTQSVTKANIYRTQQQLSANQHLHMGRISTAMTITTADNSKNPKEAAIPAVVTDMFVAEAQPGQRVVVTQIRTNNDIQYSVLPLDRSPFIQIEHSSTEQKQGKLIIRPLQGDLAHLQKIMVARLIELGAADSFQRRLDREAN